MTGETHGIATRVQIDQKFGTREHFQACDVQTAGQSQGLCSRLRDVSRKSNRPASEYRCIVIAVPPETEADGRILQRIL
jgi:hypothetical protein